MATEAQREAVKRYNQAATVQLAVRLNRRTDADIIAKLEQVESKAGYIKQLVRADIRRG